MTKLPHSSGAKQRAFKIDIIVHGRFHAFDLARALLARGQDVVVYTNYPWHVCARWDLPRERVRSFLRHGLESRVLHRLNRQLGTPALEAYVHKSFGRWAAASIRPMPISCTSLVE